MKNIKFNKECKFKRFCYNKKCKYLHSMSNYLCYNINSKNCNNCKYYHLSNIFGNILPLELINIIKEYLKPKIENIINSKLPFYLKLKNEKKYFKVIDRFIWFDIDAYCLICKKEVSTWSSNSNFICKNNMYCEDMWFKILKYYYNNNLFSKFKKNYFSSKFKYCKCEDDINSCMNCYELNFYDEISYLNLDYTKL